MTGLFPSHPPAGLPQLRLFHIALQPTTLCNLDCRYCYLPLRKQRRVMSPLVAERVASTLPRTHGPIRIVWHAGEPLACGVTHFRRLISAFGPSRPPQLTHSLQSNATLIDERWCELFLEYGIEMGISVDGTEDMSHDRRDWSGNGTHGRVMQKIALLRHCGVPFAAIAVVTSSRLDRAADLYRYASEIGCHTLCINVEETEGANVARECSWADVRRFWSDLYDAWRANPVIPIRELQRPLGLMHALCDMEPGFRPRPDLEVFPSVAVDGSVVLLSPELVDNCPQFVAGNVLETPLWQVLEGATALPYVREYLEGVTRCYETCDYFSVCGGGAASNRYFEHGRFDGSETQCCRNRTQAVVDVLLNKLQ